MEPPSNSTGQPPAPAPAPGEPDAEMQELLKALQSPATTSNMEQLEAATLQFFEAMVRRMQSDPAPAPDPDADLDRALEQGLDALDWDGVLSVDAQLCERARASGDVRRILSRTRRSSELLRTVGRLDDACAAARESTEAARKIPEMDAIVATSLENEATCVRWAGRPVEALALVDEAIRRWGNVEGLGRLTWARMVVSRARCHLAAGDLAGAVADLEECGPTVMEFADGSMLPGAHGVLVQSLGVWARLHHLAGDSAEAVQVQARALERGRAVAEATGAPLHERGPALARLLRHHAVYLEAADDPEGAAAAAAESRDLLRRLRLDFVSDIL